MTLLLALAVLATDPAPLASGVPVGKRPGPYSVLVATGPHRGKQTCFICDQADKPAAVVFARTLTPDLGTLLAKLDAEAAGRTDGFKAWLTVLADAADLDGLARWAQGQGLKLPVGTFEGVGGPPAYTLHPDADVTVLVFTKEKVTANVTAKKLTAELTADVVRAAPVSQPTCRSESCTASTSTSSTA